MAHPIVWNIRFSVGVPAMDRQHRHLIELINEIESATAAEAVSRAVKGMSEYAVRHCENEERLLEAVGYSELASQREEHRFFISKTAEFANQVGDPEVLRSQIATFLRTWLLHHILEEDMKYKRCIPERFTRDGAEGASPFD